MKQVVILSCCGAGIFNHAVTKLACVIRAFTMLDVQHAQDYYKYFIST